MTKAIEVSELSKVFYDKKEDKEVWAVDNISFSVNKGEIFALLGPNGAGKTTTIRLIAGLLKPTTGSAFVNGQQVKENSHFLRKNIGFLTENHGNYENLSVFDNLKFFGGFYEIETMSERINEVLTILNLMEKKDFRAGTLSKGQRQRLAIARAVLHDPQILFFDEPTSGLDPVAAAKVRNLISTLKTKDRTIFINSHNLEEVQRLCDRVAILDKGKIKRIGTPSELSEGLWETQETVCHVKNAVSDSMLAALNQLDFIKQLRREKNHIYLYTSDSEKYTPFIVKELVNSGAEILEVTRTIHSLEDIYLKLMDKEESKNGGIK